MKELKEVEAKIFDLLVAELLEKRDDTYVDELYSDYIKMALKRGYSEGAIAERKRIINELNKAIYFTNPNPKLKPSKARSHN